MVGTLLAQPHRCAEIISDLHADHFAEAAPKVLYAAIHKAFYADQAIDALSIATPMRATLAGLWGLEDTEVVSRVQALASAFVVSATPLRDHAAIIRRQHERRALLRLADGIVAEVGKDESEPGAIAGRVSVASLAIASHTVAATEIQTFGDAGREFVRVTRFEGEAARQGIDLGVRTDILAIDSHTRGMRPGRLYMFAGEPGVGKSAIAFEAARNFAERQGRKIESQRLGTLILSMEMGAHDSSGRFAQSIAHIDGASIQEASLSTSELEKIIREWGRRKDVPLYLNYAPNLRTHQMLALVSEAIRRHNVGFVVIDHFRTFDLDRRLDNKVDEDEEKARFLKEQIARGLNVAVLCLAHTRKPDATRQQGRPHMADLRGSGQIAAHADLVAFVYRPVMYATEEDRIANPNLQNEAEIIYRKNRHGPLGAVSLFFDPVYMAIH